MFELERAKRESGLSDHELARLAERIKAEFEGDEMLFELHLLRVLYALKEGWVTPEEALAAEVGI